MVKTAAAVAATVNSGPQWTIRCRVCKTQFGPYRSESYVAALIDGGDRLECGHEGADVVSQSL